MKDKLKKLVDKKLGIEVDENRKKSIVASILQAGITNEQAINDTIDQLAARKRETVLGYESGLNKCIYCKNKYEPVKLHNQRQAMYCSRCKVVVPNPVRN
jgi:hypothetical protein